MLNGIFTVFVWGQFTIACTQKKKCHVAGKLGAIDFRPTKQFGLLCGGGGSYCSFVARKFSKLEAGKKSWPASKLVMGQNSKLAVVFLPYVWWWWYFRTNLKCLVREKEKFPAIL